MARLVPIKGCFPTTRLSWVAFNPTGRRGRDVQADQQGHHEVLLVRLLNPDG